MTTTALGVALAWPGKVLLAECDPMGRRVLPGYMADRLRQPAGPGLLGLTTSASAESDVSALLEQCVVPLDEDGRAELLHGIRDPRHAAHLAALWPLVARALATREGDVIADVGRLGGSEMPVALLEAADLVVVALKPTLAQIDAARPRLDVLRTLVGDHGQIAVCLVSDGPYSAAEIRRVLKAPVLAELPCSPADAQVLSDGARPRRTFRASLLVRSFDRLGKRMREQTEARYEPTATSDDPRVTAQTVVEAAARTMPAGGRS
ncbi:hypothetical protein [Actinomadura sp. 3N508]|uniref:hypothetical protein n=1 Tax=Actinomadura sp. 3N508 TaxID=3375153 RepID=UPI0037AD3B4E